MPTKYDYKCGIHENGSINRSHIYRALRGSRLKECFIVRYADDFKIFCRNKEDAEKMFIATQNWLKDRLGLEISPDKSKIVNVKRNYSEFLGFKLKVRRAKGDKYFIKTHMSDKAKSKATTNLIKQIKEIQKPKNKREMNTLIDRYNSNVIGIHNYYKIATNISKDCRDIAFRVSRTIRSRLKTRAKRNSETPLTGYIKEKYGKSKQMRYVNGRPLIPIGYVQFSSPLCKKKV